MLAGRCIWAAGFHLALSACSLSVDYAGSRFVCDPPAGDCPGGFTCADDGICMPIGGLGPDADTADAPPGPDAPPPPDAGVTVTVTFGNRPTSDVQNVTFDTTLDSANSGANFGGTSEIFCDSVPVVNGLLRFELTAIPAGATVVSASLELVTGGDALQEGTIQLNQMLEDWQEGNANGGAGTANFLERLPGTFWLAAGAAPPSSDALPAASFTPIGNFTAFQVALPPALVQAWVDQPEINFGLACFVSGQVDSDSDFASSEAGNSDERPELTVTYVP